MSSIRVLSAADVADLLAVDELLPVVEHALVAQGRGAVERPERPHFPVGVDPDGDDPPAGTALTMPAAIHGADTFATKLATVHESNADRDLPTVNAQIALTDAGTGRPLAYLHGTRITNARTGCIGGLAARHLAVGPVRLGVLGAGTQARWQTRAIAAATDLDTVRVYSPSDSRETCAADLRDELGVDVAAVDSPRAAVENATVVVTTTTATESVFPGDALDPGTLVVAVGAYTPEMRELDTTTFDRAARVFADTPTEVAEIGDLRATDLTTADLVPLAAVFEGTAGREADDEIIVVESVGTAVLDAATAAHVYERAKERAVGTVVPF